MLKESVWIMVGLLAISIFILVGCEKQAKTGVEGVQTAPKTSIAGEVKTGSAGKVADVNSAKAHHEEGRKHYDAKKAERHGTISDANAAAKPCGKMMCAIGDGKAANKNICCEHKGKIYCFCCGGCKKQFEKDPEKYAGKCK